MIERQRVVEQDKIQRRSNFDAVESNLTEEQVKMPELQKSAMCSGMSR